MKKMIVILLFFNFLLLLGGDGDPDNSGDTKEIAKSDKNSFGFERFNFAYGYEDKNFFPMAELYWRYNIRFFSGIELSSINYTSDKRIGDIEKSHYASTTQEIDLTLNLLSGNILLNPITLYIGFAPEYKNIERNEFGYFLLQDTWVAFENITKMNALFPNIRIGAKHLGDYFNFGINMDFFPSYSLKLKQNTSFHPIIDEEGKHDYEGWQSPGFTIKNYLYLKTGDSLFVDFWIKSDISLWTAKYTLDTLAADGQNYFFKNDTIETRFFEYDLVFNLVFSRLSNNEIKPYIGVGYSGEKITDVKNNKSEKTKNYRLNLGVNF